MYDLTTTVTNSVLYRIVENNGSINYINFEQIVNITEYDNENCEVFFKNGVSFIYKLTPDDLVKQVKAAEV